VRKITRQLIQRFDSDLPREELEVTEKKVGKADAADVRLIEANPAKKVKLPTKERAKVTPLCPSAATVLALRSHHAEQAKERLAAGKPHRRAPALQAAAPESRAAAH
jgi:hypothetical protein